MFLPGSNSARVTRRIAVVGCSGGGGVRFGDWRGSEMVFDVEGEDLSLIDKRDFGFVLLLDEGS
jgi:hypothetical protein